jgi:hypothetical protein
MPYVPLGMQTYIKEQVIKDEIKTEPGPNKEAKMKEVMIEAETEKSGNNTLSDAIT